MADNGQNTEDVYERVRNAILDGQLAPGAVMSQVALAQDLGISRTPLREALRMLQSEGLVEGEPNRRVRVAPMTAARPRGAVRDARHARGGGAAPVGAADDLRGSGAARGAHGRDGALRRREGLPALEPPAPAVSPRLDRPRRRAGQLRARADVRPRRALPAAAHRPRPDRVGDRRSPRDPRCLQGRGPRRERRPAGLASGQDRVRGLRAARPGVPPKLLELALADAGGAPPSKSRGRRKAR